MYSTEDQYSTIQIKEDLNIRSLHFNNTSKQSAMYINKPNLLALEYIRNLSSSILFTEVFDKILFLGLGGGSLPRFFHQFFPESKIDVVELRPIIYDISKKYFDFPEHENITIHINDALHFVQEAKTKYDIVFVDIFTATGLAPVALHFDFIKYIKNLVEDHGLFAVNLWSNALYESIVLEQELSTQHHNNIYKIFGKIHNNEIYVGKAMGDLETNKKILQDRAIKYSCITKINFVKIIKRIFNQNELFR